MQLSENHHFHSSRQFNQAQSDLENGSLPTGFRADGPQAESPMFVSLARSYGLAANELRSILGTIGHGGIISGPNISLEDISSVDKLLQSLGIEKRQNEGSEKGQIRVTGEGTEAGKGGAQLVAFPEFIQIVKKRLADEATPIRIKLQGAAWRGAFIALVNSVVSEKGQPSVVGIISSVEEQLALHETLAAHCAKLMECDQEAHAATLVFSGSKRYFLTPRSALEYLDFRMPQGLSHHPLAALYQSRRLPEDDPFLIFQEPHYSTAAQLALYHGLTVLYRANRHWFGSNTVFVIEGVERGREVVLDQLRAVNPAPSEDVIQQAIGSLLVPGHLAFLWAHNPPIKALGGEDPVLYRASARLARKVSGFMAAILRKEDIFEFAEEALFTKAVWHSVVFARNCSMVREVMRLKSSGMRPVLFVGFLHVDEDVWRYHQQQLQKLELNEELLWQSAHAYGLLTTEEAAALRKVKGGPLQSLLKLSQGPWPTFVDTCAWQAPEAENTAREL